MKAAPADSGMEAESSDLRMEAGSLDPASRVSIRLNGEIREWPEPRSVATLLSELGIDTRMVAVERNRSVVKRARYEETVIQGGDEIEIVSFVGGG